MGRLFGLMLLAYVGMATALFAWALASTPRRERQMMALAIAQALLAFVLAAWPIIAPLG